MLHDIGRILLANCVINSLSLSFSLSLSLSLSLFLSLSLSLSLSLYQDLEKRLLTLF